ncbi:MAG: YCF48-related protein, partial [Bacteroidota bacterium]
MKKTIIISIALCLLSISTFAQWNQQISNTPSDLNGIFFLSSDTGFAVGNDGAFIKTTNGGANWTMGNSGITQKINSVFFLNSNIGFATCTEGIIIKTINGGTNWSTYNCGTTNSINAIRFTDNSNGFAVGDGGIILYTTNAGANWNAQTSNTTQNLNAIFSINNQTIVTVGANGVILKTINAGSTWTSMPSGISNIFKSVYFTDANTGYVVGTSGKVLKTTNGGSTWSQKVSGCVNNLHSVYFTSSNVGYASGASGKIIKTNDGGTSWISLVSGISYDINSIHFPATDTGYAACVGGIILKTTNGGLTPPSITYQTPSQARKRGNSISLKVSSYGTNPLSFQWKLNGNILQNKIDSVLTISSIDFNNEGYYTCEVTNMLRTVVSDSIELTISDNIELIGDSVFFSINNTMGTVQWQSSIDTLNWIDIPNANSSMFAFKSVHVDSGKKFYRAKITDPNCPIAGPYYSKIIRNRIVENANEVPVGANYHGGIVFSIDGSGNGLIAAPTDQSSSVEWGCMGISIPDNSAFNGAINTVDIISACATRPIAASICDTLNLMSYDDWFLPAQYQLQELLKLGIPFTHLILFRFYYH